MTLDIPIMTPRRVMRLDLLIHSLIPARQQIRVFQLLQKLLRSDRFKAILHQHPVPSFHQPARCQPRSHLHSRWRASKLSSLTRSLSSLILVIVFLFPTSHQTTPLLRMRTLQRHSVLEKRARGLLPVCRKLRRVPARCVPQPMLPGKLIEGLALIFCELLAKIFPVDAVRNLLLTRNLCPLREMMA